MTTDFITSVRLYCQGKSSSSPEALTTNVIQKITHLSILEKITTVQKLQREFKNTSANPSAVKLLKTAFAASKPSWKEALFNTPFQIRLKGSRQFLKYSNLLSEPLDLAKRSVTLEAEPFVGMICSTFATNKPHRMDTQGHVILDAFCATQCQDGGWALALGDGAGGHFGDQIQDQKIAQASLAAVKACTQFFSLYTSSDVLMSELGSLVGLIGKTVQHKAQGEGSTLVGCRIFPEKEGYRIIGCNIGDGMLIGWHPATRTFYSLLAAHVSEAGTAFLPSSYRAFEVQSVNTVVPAGIHLFLLSDGVHDHLPHQEEEKAYGNGLKYRIRTLTGAEKIWEKTPLEGSLRADVEALIRSCFQKAEEERQQHLKGSDEVQMGDDVAIVSCKLR